MSVEWLCGVDDGALPFVRGWEAYATTLGLMFRINSWYSDMHGFFTPGRYRTHPTTGMVMAALVAALCDEVRLFGFADFDGPHHYYDAPSPAPPRDAAAGASWLELALCPFYSRRSPLGWVGVWQHADDDGSWWHDFEFEHAIFDAWAEEGLTLNVCHEEAWQSPWSHQFEGPNQRLAYWLQGWMHASFQDALLVADALHLLCVVAIAAMVAAWLPRGCLLLYRRLGRTGGCTATALV